MKNKRIWELSPLLAILLVAGLAIISVGSKSDTSSGVAYALSSPSLLAQATGFPSDQAGLAVIGNIGAVDYVQLFDAISPLIDVRGSDGATYIWGTRTVEGQARGGWTDEVGLYADVNGVVAAFLLRGTEAARVAFWHPNGDQLSEDNGLEEALKPLVLQLGVSFPSLKTSLRYSHFAYPQAIALTLFAAYEPKRMSFLVPDGLTLYEASYNGANARCGSFRMLLNQREVEEDSSCNRKIGRFGEVPEVRTEPFTQPGGLAAGATFPITVVLPPILDTNGDGSVTAQDINLDTSGLAVEALDDRRGVITFRVAQASPVDKEFNITYTGSKVPAIFTGTPYELVIEGYYSRAAFVLIWGPE